MYSIITVEGNIGAGKTSFASSLYNMMKQSGQQVIYFPEPVEAWKNIGGQNILDMMYSDRQRWAFTFQVCALLFMEMCDENAYSAANRGFVVIRERSINSAKNIFVPITSKYLSSAETHILNLMCESPAIFGLPLTSALRDRHVTIYLRTDPKICYQRVKTRGRLEEIDDRVDLDYLAELHAMHEKLFSPDSSNGPLIIADGDKFDMSDPTSLKVYGSDQLVCEAIVQQPTVCEASSDGDDSEADEVNAEAAGGANTAACADHQDLPLPASRNTMQECDDSNCDGSPAKKACYSESLDITRGLVGALMADNASAQRDLDRVKLIVDHLHRVVHGK